MLLSRVIFHENMSGVYRLVAVRKLAYIKSLLKLFIAFFFTVGRQARQFVDFRCGGKIVAD